MSNRTATGAVAWSLSLVTIPVVALPAYWVFGRNKFEGYLEARRNNQSEIGQAEDYVLVQFYIVHDDGLGRRLKDAMIERAVAEVDVFFLYDEVGSTSLTDDYREDLEAAGVKVSNFNTTQGRRNKLQLNFRNHRKVVVADGKTAWIGGHNVGDEYLVLALRCEFVASAGADTLARALPEPHGT